MTKDTTKKTRCPKNSMLTAKEVAELAGCSESYVKQIRLGLCDLETDLAKRVIAIDEIADKSKSFLIKEIVNVVKL